jgi:hypothetical protein
VNLVSVVMNWMNNASEENAQVLAETMLIYHGVDRGSEHASFCILKLPGIFF